MATIPSNIPPEAVDDLPESRTAGQAEFWAWRPVEQRWEVVASPALGDAMMIDGNVVTVDIPAERIPFDKNAATNSRGAWIGTLYLAIAPTAGLPPETDPSFAQSLWMLK